MIGPSSVHFAPTILVLSGPAMGPEAVGRLQYHLESGVVQAQPNFVIDCRYVEHAGTDFASAITKYARRLDEKGGGLRLTGVSRSVHKVLELTHTLRSVSVYPSIGAAIVSLREQRLASTA